MENTDEKRSPVAGYEGLYEITRCGKVYGVREGYGKAGERGDLEHRRKIVSLSNMGYWRLILWKDGDMKNQLLHRLVASAFIPNPEGKSDVNHLDGDRANCHVDNLEWCTHAEKMAHAKAAGRMGPVNPSRGEDHPHAKLTAERVRDARRRHGRGLASMRDLARENGVCVETMGAAVRGATWSHVQAT